MEIFDENLAHISTWLYQTQIHLDEAERLPPTEREKVVKVRKRRMHFLNYNQRIVEMHEVFCFFSHIDTLKTLLHSIYYICYNLSGTV